VYFPEGNASTNPFINTLLVRKIKNSRGSAIHAMVLNDMVKCSSVKTVA